MFFTFTIYRNPEHHERRTIPEVFSYLSSIDEQSLKMSIVERHTSPKAAILGAPLQEGNALFPDLQKIYIHRI